MIITLILTIKYTLGYNFYVSWNLKIMYEYVCYSVNCYRNSNGLANLP